MNYFIIGGLIFLALDGLFIFVIKFFFIRPIMNEGPTKAELDRAVEQTWWQIHNEMPIKHTSN